MDKMPIDGANVIVNVDIKNQIHMLRAREMFLVRDIDKYFIRFTNEEQAMGGDALVSMTMSMDSLIRLLKATEKALEEKIDRDNLEAKGKVE